MIPRLLWTTALLALRAATWAYLIERLSTLDAVVSRFWTSRARFLLFALALTLERLWRAPAQLLVDFWLAALHYEHLAGRAHHGLYDRDCALLDAHRAEKRERAAMLAREAALRHEKLRRADEEARRRRDERFRSKHWVKTRIDYRAGACVRQAGGESRRGEG